MTPVSAAVAGSQARSRSRTADPDHQQTGRQEDRQQSDAGTEDAGRSRRHRRSEERREGEQRTGDGLSGTIAGEERVVVDESRRHEFGFEQRQDDMTAAEDQSSGPIEDVDEANGRVPGRRGERGQSEEQCGEGDEGSDAQPPGTA